MDLIGLRVGRAGRLEGAAEASERVNRAWVHLLAAVLVESS